LGDFYSWSAIEFETDKFCLVIHEHIMREWKSKTKYFSYRIVM
jgi:hypothetical protein